MKGRASLPGADELFRVTSIDKGRGARGAKQAAGPGDPKAAGGPGDPKAPGGPGDPKAPPPAERASSGRRSHEEKVTFYCTAEELMDLEHARLRLRRDHGIGVDRGRIVREALAQVLSELERDGADAALVKRLRP